MKLLMASLISLSLSVVTTAQTKTDFPLAANHSPAIEIIRNESQASAKAPAQYFTGSVQVDQLFSAQDPSRLSGGVVTFEPGARSAWHTHPLGQILIVTSGVGRIQAWGGPIQEIRAGDVVRIPPGVKHWHGAAPTAAMTHIAIQESVEGKAVDWMEKVSDERYNGPVQVSR